MVKFSGYSHLKIHWNQHQINQKDGFLPSSPSPYKYDDNSPDEWSPCSSSSGAKISPAVVLITVVLAVLFFISGLLHLLMRFLTKSTTPSQSNRNAEDYSSSDALQRQLQQLFDLHDSGLDQAFIDALPVFSYNEISGPKEPFDCAVCLCEFSEADELRLLPICSHAFHINCIDTWLLSNSTCPLCRGALLIPGFSFVNPVFDYDDDFREEGGDCHGGNGSDDQKRVEIEENTTEKGVFPVKLGKFRRLNDVEGVGDESSSSSALDARRCYSMGSYEYVVGNAELRVALSQDQTGRGSNRVKGDESRSSALDARRCYSMGSHQ
ncbi:RING/U-box superfamily protein [Perilla frutescens var. frutescens]|nr:RING/U-box superfamily protein [Perilla frutescens var. frutescens]